MKVLGISPRSFIKTSMVALPLLCATSYLKAQERLPKDKFEKSEKIVNLEPNISIEDMSPCLRLMDGKVYPALVIDLKNKQMYQYSLNTYIEDVHPVETAKRSSKGLKGLNVVKHVFKDKDGFTMIVLQELNNVTGEPSKESVNLITDAKDRFGKNKHSIILETSRINKITEDLEPEQYVWIK